jgi:uncharacterized membrane protein (GlpM family)
VDRADDGLDHPAGLGRGRDLAALDRPLDDEAAVVCLILLAQRRDNSALAAAAATVPIGTIIGLVAFASADPSRAQTFTRSAVLALPVWAAFAISTFLLTRVLDWRLAVGARLLVWFSAALLYLHLTR